MSFADAGGGADHAGAGDSAGGFAVHGEPGAGVGDGAEGGRGRVKRSAARRGETKCAGVLKSLANEGKRRQTAASSSSSMASSTMAVAGLATSAMAAHW